MKCRPGGLACLASARARGQEAGWASGHLGSIRKGQFSWSRIGKAMHSVYY